MSEGKRPGGLTALAVINFVLGGLAAIGLLILSAALGSVETAAQAEGVGTLSTGSVWLLLLLGIVTAGLMITAGVGYLGQKRFLGRTLGNAYAVCSLIAAAIGISMVGFKMQTMVDLVYPLLTLFLLNNTFKDDLVN